MSVGAEETAEATTEVVEETAAETQEPEQEVQETAEEEVSSEDSSGEPAEEESQEQETAEWITDDVRDLAASYGMEEDELTGFGSGEDFQRACRLVDRTLRRFQEEPEEEAEESSGEEAEPPVAEEKPAAGTGDDLSLDPSKYTEYDEPTQHIVKVAKQLQDENRALRAEFATMGKQVQNEFSRLAEERQEALVQAELSQFHDVMDEMDEELFGGDGKLSDEQNKRREAVWDAYEVVRRTQARAKAAGGRPPKLPPMKALVRRAAMVEFGDEMFEAQRKSIYRSIHEQSRGRRPSPGRRKVVGETTKRKEPETIHEAAQELVNDPEVAAVFDKHEEESGSAPQ